MSETMTVPKAAQELGLTDAIVRRLARTGQLAAIIIPGERDTIRIYSDSVESFRTRTTQQKEAI